MTLHLTAPVTAPASFATSAFAAPTAKTTSGDAVSSAKVNADALTANKLFITKQAAVSTEEAQEQQSGTKELGENLGTIFSAKA